jgi:magnesium chelatase family protein
MSNKSFYALLVILVLYNPPNNSFMSGQIFSAVNKGLETIRIEVEIKTIFGKPSFIIIGLANRVIDESRERITAALSQCGVRIRPKKTVVNLAPADLNKKSSSVELAIAVAMLKLYGEINLDTHDSLFLGELALDGRIRKINGFVSIALAAQTIGFRKIYFPRENLGELPNLPGLEFYPLASLQEFLAFGRGYLKVQKAVSQNQNNSPAVTVNQVDFSQIFGQLEAKRALEIVAAGRHNLLMFGPPGSGKSLLAQALLSILPDLSEEEFLEVNRIYSLCGLLKDSLLNARPFRAPHQSISQLALIGGGINQIPGEISLAHRGILFLDEFAEFKHQLIEMLRQPLETGSIEINQGNQRCLYPANFTLLAASNPCPCGFAGSNNHACRCSEYDLKRYQSKFSGPILDRIDLMLRVEAVEVKTMSGNVAESSESIKVRVAQAVARQQRRYVGTTFRANADLSSQAVRQFCQIEPSAKKILDLMANHKKLSTRSYFKLFKVAQTIADLAEVEIIQKEHVLEAFNFRDFFI